MRLALDQFKVALEHDSWNLNYLSASVLPHFARGTSKRSNGVSVTNISQRIK